MYELHVGITPFAKWIESENPKYPGLASNDKLKMEKEYFNKLCVYLYLSGNSMEKATKLLEDYQNDYTKATSALERQKIFPGTVEELQKVL